MFIVRMLLFFRTKKTSNAERFEYLSSGKPIPELLFRFMENLLRAQRERGTGDAGRQLQPFDDLLPQFFVDHVDESAARNHQIVQLVQIQHRLGHNGQPIDGRTCWFFFWVWTLVELQKFISIDPGMMGK